MGRPPCCDKVGVKKGPWTPEEDLLLVSYVQQHGPGNWRAVPTNAGLLRCSKSCRLRWTNYLRPGVKRGNFTEQEEKTIVDLQALLGNRWAAIAAYLPHRTDNDIKNYWNTHLKKKLAKSERSSQEDGSSSESPQSNSPSKGLWERRLQTDIHKAKRELFEALSLGKSDESPPPPPPVSSSYASNAENIARLLENWMNKPSSAGTKSADKHSTCGGGGASKSLSLTSSGPDETKSCSGNVSPKFSVGNLSAGAAPLHFQELKLAAEQTQIPLSFFDKWLIEDSSSQGQFGDFIDMAIAETADLL